MSYEEMRTKEDFPYVSICSLSILYNGKFILMATSMGANDVDVKRAHCTEQIVRKNVFWLVRSVWDFCCYPLRTYFRV